MKVSRGISVSLELIMKYMIDSFYSREGFNKEIDLAIKEELKSFEHIKTVQVKDNKVIKEEFHGDLGELSPDTEEEQYETLMNTFLNRKDRRKLSRYKGFKSFSDRFR